MIDTVTVTVHDINGINKNALDFLRHPKRLQSRMARMAFSDQEVGEFLSVPSTGVRFAKYYDSGKVMFVVERSKFNVGSYAYEITVVPKVQQNIIQITFSLPKYFLGNNVAQFIIDPSDLNFDRRRHQNLAAQVVSTYGKFRYELRRFFIQVLGLIPPDHTVQISRMDICFNDIFDTKQECFDYLLAQKQIRKKYAGADKINDYRTTVWWPSETTGTYKAYQKGEEFKSHDRNKILKIQKRTGAKVNINRLQELADRTIRHELTYSSAALNYCYKMDVLRKKNVLYDSTWRQLDRINSKKNRRKMLTKEEKTFYKNFQFVKDKRMSFFLALPPVELERSKRILDPVAWNQKAVFDLHFFGKMVERFVEKYSLLTIKDEFDKESLGVGIGLHKIAEKAVKDFVVGDSRPRRSTIMNITRFLRTVKAYDYNFGAVKELSLIHI